MRKPMPRAGVLGEKQISRCPLICRSTFSRILVSCRAHTSIDLLIASRQRAFFLYSAVKPRTLKVATDIVQERADRRGELSSALVETATEGRGGRLRDDLRHDRGRDIAGDKHTALYTHRTTMLAAVKCDAMHAADAHANARSHTGAKVDDDAEPGGVTPGNKKYR